MRRLVSLVALFLIALPGGSPWMGAARAIPAEAAASGTSPASGAPAAAGHPSSRFERTEMRADSLFLKQRPDSALSLLEPLLSTARSSGDSAGELRILLAQARILGYIGRPVPGESAAASALELAWALHDTTSACRALRWLAVATGAQGKSEQAESHAQRLRELALGRNDREHEAHASLLLAFGRLQAGFPEAARGEYERAIALYHQLGNTRFEMISQTGLGRCHYALGDWDRACRCYRAVVEETRRTGDPFAEADALNNLGGVEFLRGDPGRAVDLYRRAYEQQVRNGNPEGAISPAINLAIAETYAGRLREAGEMLEDALHICEEHGYQSLAALVDEQLGIVRARQRRYEEAAAHFRRGAASGGQTPPETRARNLLGLVETLARMDSIPAGLAALDADIAPLREQVSLPIRVKADRLRGEFLLKLNRPREALTCLLQADRIASPLGIGFRAGPLALAGRCLIALGQADSARALLVHAAQVWEEERARSHDPAWREQLGIDARVLHATLAECLLEPHQALTDESRARLAFDTLQRFKARTLRERMLGQTPTGDPRLDPVTTNDLQRSVLRDGELLLDAFFGTERVILFAVSRAEFRAVRLGQDAGSLEDRLRRFRTLLSDSLSRSPHAGSLRFLAASDRLLSETLLGPVADLIGECDRILYSPDGPLNLVPLGVLARPESTAVGTSEASPRLTPLLASHEVVRVPSATALAELRMRAPARAGGSQPHAPPRARPPRAHPRVEPAPAILAIAGPAEDGTSVLPGVRSEVRWLARRYRGVQTTIAGPPVAPVPFASRVPLAAREQSGESAETTTSALEGKDILHFAGHTRIDDACPWRSAILLPATRAPDALVPEDSLRRDGDPGDEFTLSAQTIARMRLTARLAFLSGCESAGGPIVSGEGVLGLTAAFIAAGVPAVVATLWPVDDQVTARLVREFYRLLEQGETAAAALRDAQLAVRREAATSHPFFWAGFILVGDGDVTPEPAPSPWPLRLKALLSSSPLPCSAALLGLIAALCILALAGALLVYAGWSRRRQASRQPRGRPPGR